MRRRVFSSTSLVVIFVFVVFVIVFVVARRQRPQERRVGVFPLQDRLAHPVHYPFEGVGLGGGERGPLSMELALGLFLS